jgi:uncharacterized membrane protein YkoI
MKRIIVVGLMMASMSAFAQKIDASKVPASALATFNKSFPGTKDVKWEIENGNYEANFKQNGEKKSVLIDAKGGLVETETGIAVSALPASIADYVAKNYKGEKIKEAAKLKMANGDINYEAEVKGMDLIFDANGKFIKSVKD